MQQIHALQEMVRNQPAGGSKNVLDSVEMKVLQRNLDAAQAELQKTESRLSEINPIKIEGGAEPASFPPRAG